MKCHRCQGGPPGYVCAGCIDKVAARTPAQRKAAQRAREAAAGLSEVRGIMAPPELHQAIKEAAAKVKRKGVAVSRKPE